MCHGPAFTENNISGALEVTSLVSAKCAVKLEPGDDLTQLACKVWLQHILGFYLAPHKSTCCCVQWAVAQRGVLTTEIKFCGFSAVQIFKWRMRKGTSLHFWRETGRESMIIEAKQQRSGDGRPLKLYATPKMCKEHRGTWRKRGEHAVADVKRKPREGWNEGSSFKRMKGIQTEREILSVGVLSTLLFCAVSQKVTREAHSLLLKRAGTLQWLQLTPFQSTLICSLK